jgi:Steigviridae/Suoliviridae L,D-carboxypeptidase/transpeptidase
MKLTLVRRIFTDTSTIGELAIEGEPECLTLEDPVRDRKIKGKTAIPAGTYGLVVALSPRFRRRMPRLENVPGFEGILIHWGNTAADTEGCILVGQSKAKDFVGGSKAAFNALFKKLEAAAKTGPISIRVR